jgi:hypothetical protein
VANPICQHEGCTETGSPCFLNAWDDDEDGDAPAEYYCAEHARDAGYCFVCGLFRGGIESFEFGDGRCDNCRESSDDDDRFDDADCFAEEDFEILS